MVVDVYIFLVIHVSVYCVLTSIPTSEATGTRGSGRGEGKEEEEVFCCLFCLRCVQIRRREEERSVERRRGGGHGVEGNREMPAQFMIARGNFKKRS